MITYEDALSGEPILIEGVGHLRSPHLSEMKPVDAAHPERIGWQNYHLYLSMMKAGPEDLAKLMHTDTTPDDVFTTVLSDELMKALYCEAFTFFMSEVAVAPERATAFLVLTMNEDGEPVITGAISAENFDEVRGDILRLNYISLAETDVQNRYDSPAAEAAWKKIQAYLAQNEQKKEADPSSAIGNLISKLSAIHPSYTLQTIYDLTVFQFYDQFFQCSYMRSINFTEDIVANHGSDSFKFEDWMKPVNLF